MSGFIDYGKLMHRAMRGLIQDVLTGVQITGLPGVHHFFITFDTTHPEARLADWLLERYPEEMTVVMQNWFDDLQVNNDGFSITLNFGDAPENLYIPFDAIRTFVDPSVEFGLRFDSHDDGEEGEDTPTEEAAPKALTPTPVSKAKSGKKTKAKPGKSGGKDADVVSLDSFRK